MRGKLLSQNVKLSLQVFWMLADDVVVRIEFHETAGRRANGGTHISHEETTGWRSADLVGNGGQQSSVALQELGSVRIGHVKEVCRILRFQEGEQPAANQSLSIS